MRGYFAEDERFCLICGQPLSSCMDANALFLADRLICASCARSFTVLDKTFHENGRTIHVLFEYDAFMERLFFQFKEGRDVLLADCFLTTAWVRRLRRHDLLSLASWHEKAADRGFETLDKIAASHGLHVFYPFEKTSPYKQSSLSKESRTKTAGHMRRRSCGNPSFRDPVIFEDVLTTGATLNGLFELSGLCEAWVLAAHPLWLKEHKKSEDRSVFAMFLDHFIVWLQDHFQGFIKS